MSWNEPRQAYFRQPGLPLYVFGLDDQFPTGMHGHEFSELVFVVRGRAVHVFQPMPEEEARVSPLEYGDVFVIHPPAVHGYRNTDCLSIWNVLFDPNGLELPASLADTMSTYRRFFDPRYQQQAGCGLADRRTHLDAVSLNRAQTLVRRIIREQQQRSPGWRLGATAAFTELVLLVCRAAPADFPEEPPRHGWLTTITDYLETHFSRQVSLGDLAEMVHMSPSSLSHSFKRRLGCSPIEYVLSLRVQRAAEMLRDTSASIADIGEGVGFTDSNYFSRQFKNRLGLSPSAYRRRYRDLVASRTRPTVRLPSQELPPECCG